MSVVSTSPNGNSYLPLFASSAEAKGPLPVSKIESMQPRAQTSACGAWNASRRSISGAAKVIVCQKRPPIQVQAANIMISSHGLLLETFGDTEQVSVGPKAELIQSL